MKMLQRPVVAPDLTGALDEWRAALGSAHVTCDSGVLSMAESATFAVTRQVPAIVKPGNRDEVVAALDVANRYRLPVYPISTGKNWGYGSKVPTADGCAVLDLSRLNRIVDYDEELAYVTVEPGVTQRQLYEFLRAKGSKLWLDVTGSSPDCSIIGNTVERGFGHTPHGDHFAQVCGMEVVLPTGKVLNTGFGRFANAKASKVYRWGVGPSIDGLFTQSNFGVVTQMTIWLMPAPEYFQAFYIAVKDDEELEWVVDTLRPLRIDGTIRSAVHVVNDYKVLSSLQKFPWSDATDHLPLQPHTIKRLRETWRFGAWNISGALYGTRAEVAAARRKIKRAFGARASRMRFMDDRKVRWVQAANRWLGNFLPAKYRRLSRLLESMHGLKQGIPTDAMIESVYWRKKPTGAATGNPNDDRCGLMWCAPISPTRGEYARRMVDITTETLRHYGFEPMISMTALTERSLDNVVAIVFDRDVPGEDSRALQCHAELMSKLTDEGYFPYRLGIQSMDMLPSGDDGYYELRDALKAAIDPNSILSPGRYDQ